MLANSPRFDGEVMLPDLETAVDTEIVRENVQAVQAIYFAYCLEQMRMFQVLERLAQLFQQELLPLGEGSAAETLRAKHWPSTGCRRRSALRFMRACSA
jgi:hypothetical protein